MILQPELSTTQNSALSLAELRECCQNPWGLESYSAIGEHKYLLLRCEDDAAALDAAAAQMMVQRLRDLPCPVLSTGPVPERLVSAVDVAEASDQDIARMARNIEQHPMAAMTLVQLLRHHEHGTPEAALHAESLAYATLQAGEEFAAATLPIPDQVPGDESQSPVLLHTDGACLHIALNRPHARNAYNTAMRDALFEALLLLREDPALTHAIVKGEGSCFSIGGDLAEFRQCSDAAMAHAIRCTRNVPALLLQMRSQLEFRLHGACIGAGIELPSFARTVVAERCSFFQLPEITFGLLPGAGGTVSVMGRIGRHRTAYMALSARRIKAPLALEWGLLDDII